MSISPKQQSSHAPTADLEAVWPNRTFNPHFVSQKRVNLIRNKQKNIPLARWARVLTIQFHADALRAQHEYGALGTNNGKQGGSISKLLVDKEFFLPFYGVMHIFNATRMHGGEIENNT